MKKTLITLGAAVVLLVIVLLISQRNDRSMRGDAFVFDTTKKAEANYLKVYDHKDTSVLAKAGGQWVSLPDSFPVDTSKINRNLGYLLSLQDKELVSRSPSRLAEYGLDTAQAKHVEWHGEGKSPKFVIGKTAGTDYSSTYWKWEDKPEVYATPGNFTWEIAARSADWKDHQLFKADFKDARSVETDWRDSAGVLYHYKLEAVNDTTFRLVEPETVAVRKDQAQALINRAVDMSLDDFPAANDTNLSKAMADTPAVDVKVTLKSGKSYELKASKTRDNYAYVRYPFRKDYVKVGPWRFDPFRKKPFELAVPQPGAVAPEAAAKPADKKGLVKKTPKPLVKPAAAAASAKK